MAKKSRQRSNRRDRRKAKASGFAREGTANPRKKGHHAYIDPLSAATPDRPASSTEPPCLRDFALHDFIFLSELGVEQCRLCGCMQKPEAPPESPFPGQHLELAPEPARRSPVSRPPTPMKSPCRGAHEYRSRPDLGIDTCAECGHHRRTPESSPDGHAPSFSASSGSSGTSAPSAGPFARLKSLLPRKKTEAGEEKKGVGQPARAQAATASFPPKGPGRKGARPCAGNRHDYVFDPDLGISTCQACGRMRK